MPQPLLSPRLSLSLFALACLVGEEIGELVAVRGGPAIELTLNPTVGILVGALLVVNRDRRLALALTAFGVMVLSAVVLHARPFVLSIGLATVVVFEAILAEWFVRRARKHPLDLSHVDHTGTLIVAAALAPAVGGALAAAVLLLNAAPSLPVAWRGWWMADSLGILLTAPIVVAATIESAGHSKLVRPWRMLETAVVFAAAIVVSESLFGDVVSPLVRVPTYVLPFLVWPVFRLGPGGTASMTLVICFIGLLNVLQGLTPFALADAPRAVSIFRAQGAMVIATVSFLLLASIVAERKRVLEQHVILVEQLRQALAEIRTLRGFIPVCAWCHKVRDDAGFWQEIEVYLHERTDATFSHGICPTCRQTAMHEIEHHEAAALSPPS